MLLKKEAASKDGEVEAQGGQDARAVVQHSA